MLHFSFDTEKKKWHTVKSMNYGHTLGSAAVFNGYIYVAGGNVKRSGTTAVELYDPNSDKWTKAPSMNKPRARFALIASSGFLYAMGHDKQLERFDPNKNCWTMVCAFVFQRY